LDNNITKFALSKNPFKCDGCEFQKIWWKHYRRIVDIREVTCVSNVVEDGGNPQIVTFYDLVKNTVCSEEAISDEIRFLIICLGVLVPLTIALLICCTRQQRVRERTLKKKAAATVESSRSTPQPRSYSPTRSKVADMDNSKF
jgi:hypothetical protein